MTDSDDLPDFIVVGSGAGGGPLAANLAEAGFSVLLIEAGSDHRCPYYDVPIMQARASEDPDMRWDFFVRHYADDARQRRDSKFVPDRDGVLYPRGATLGGSTAISALVTIYPHNSDWDDLAALTGNPDWSADAMRARFQRVEAWRGRDPDPDHPARPGDASRHGFDGWLKVTRANPALASREPWFLDVINAIEAESRATYGTPDEVVLPNDPNDWRFVSERREGMAFIPVSVDDGRRNGARERILAAQRAHPDRLRIRYDALVSRVIIEKGRAVGVACLDGAHLYGADPGANHAHGPGAPLEFRCRREVILAGGAYNTPQLLKLSGIGPRQELENLGIPVLLDRPGVGANLQDRYEIGVVHRTVHDYPVFEGAVLDVPGRDGIGDPLYSEWAADRGGPYSTNGSLASFIARSSVAGAEPDLIVFALPVDFHGYFPGYSAESALKHDQLTFVVLKAHTRNRAGTVTLNSTDPRDPPQIRFAYFDEGSEGGDDDLQAVVEGIGIARRIAARLDGMIAEEIIPGPKADDPEALRQFVRDEAWGHHASCTCAIGAEDDPMAVLDGDFRLRGIDGLRVVDASVFPRIPGIFIASAVYMISERASDVIIGQYSERGGTENA
ncbi:GMC family oxidoreductase N-terminal domain-containing protein [Paracoccus caeni]|uniref:GMC family oxidoreductase N-terminal domain-containing protein n=1 Tax=Paracoccus caeni TaxID=657651 RepID=A0A934SCU4_9RHOB|nr:GMC oxidoreductase [Paracoccus caeni]MBK4215562.1 GMC family oxidoreductase N-terminal domain-containing protein [Paracoccus caeni]